MLLGYYVHLHGKGHAQRAKAIAQHLSIPITFIGTGISQNNWEGVDNYQLLDLPPDKIEYVPDLPINQDCQTYSFHYAPYYSAAYRQRAMIISNWVAKNNPTAVIVDVSAEITQYLRFLGVPVIAVRQHGDRTDYPHLAGYDAAYKLFAPFPHILEYGNVPSWIQAKTIYSPGFSRYCGRSLDKHTARNRLNISSQRQVVLVLNGRGGGKHSLTRIAAAALETPEWLWLVVGQTNVDCHAVPNNVSIEGWCEDTYLYLKAADVAIASAGHNTIMEIGAAKIPFICIPEERPFDEQKIKAQLLQKLNLCIVMKDFLRSGSLKEILQNVKKINIDNWDRIIAVDGAAQAANTIKSEVKLLNSWHESTTLSTNGAI